MSTENSQNKEGSSSEITFPDLGVLCVDDDPVILLIMAQVVTSAGFKAVTAANVAEAWATIQSHADQLLLVISDFNMPDASGFDLRRLMMTNHRDIPFVVVSGQLTRDEVLKAVELKVSNFIAKPFEIQQAVAVIKAESKSRLDSINDDRDMLKGFIEEARGLLEEVEELILSLEDVETRVEAVNRIFACLHTIKGTSGYFKPDLLHRFSHRYEDYLSKFKQFPEHLNAHAIGILLQGVDQVRQLLNIMPSGKIGELTLESLVAIFSAPAKNAAITGAKLGTSPDHTAAATGASTAGAAPQGGATMALAVKTNEDLKVSLSLINQFQEESGQITVFRNMVSRVLKDLETSYAADAHVHHLGELLQEMHKSVSRMQDRLEDLRKVMFRQVTKPLERAVRDLTAQLKKPLRLAVEGEDMQIDHTLAAILGKCLIHLVRNSADHGIENPADRLASGKEAMGTIRISCVEKSDYLWVKIEDDGKGIDAIRIREKAIEKKVVSEAHARAMTDKEVLLLIFESGFSTAQTVTDVSGRGVGTDMVKKTIESIGGRIELSSVLGQGTEFLLVLPIPKSVVILPSLLVRIGGESYALPQEQVERVLLLDEETDARLRRIGDCEFLDLDSNLIPILRTSSTGMGPCLSSTSAAGHYIWVRGKNSNYCLQVDEVLEIEDLVKKNIPAFANESGVYKGATFLGSGRIGLILNIDGMARIAGLEKSRMQATPSQTAPTVEEVGEPILAFKFRGSGAYAISREAVVRLEMYTRDIVKKLNGRYCIVHDQKIVELIPLGESLIPSQATEMKQRFETGTEPVYAILIEHDRRLKALLVDEILGFSELDRGGAASGWQTGEALTMYAQSTGAISYLDLHEYFAAKVAA